MERKYTSHLYGAYATKKEAEDYIANFPTHHKDEKDILIISSSKPELNEFGYWQVKIVFKHN